MGIWPGISPYLRVVMSPYRYRSYHIPTCGSIYLNLNIFCRYMSGAERNWYNRNQEATSGGNGGRNGNGSFSQSTAAELAGTLSLLAATTNYYSNGHNNHRYSNLQISGIQMVNFLYTNRLHIWSFRLVFTNFLIHLL